MTQDTPNLLTRAIAMGHTGPMSKSSWAEAVGARVRPRLRTIEKQLQAAVKARTMRAIPAFGRNGSTIHYEVISQ
jgi:hypothetical protein